MQRIYVSLVSVTDERTFLLLFSVHLSYSLTLIDALDTLAVMENYTEFGRVVGILIDKAETFFNMDINVSVFETNIRGVAVIIYSVVSNLVWVLGFFLG